MTNRAICALALSLASGACEGAEAMEHEEIPIACRLDAMSAAERAHEQALLAEHRATYVEVSERDDGYAYRYPADPALFARIAELVAIEHRCCPFLDFSLEWQGGDAPPWLRIGGGARVKPFVAGAFGAPDD